MTLFYAKLVIIEVGGWVEMSMDDLAYRAGKTLVAAPNAKYLEREVIRKNYGFDYEKNFRPMLMKVIGLVRLEKLERNLDVSKHTKMKAALELLKNARNSVAHTYVKNPSGGMVIAAPSVSLSYFSDIYDGLKDIEEKMKSLKLI
ncbi:MAG: hypothetical protein WA159_01420 [Variovorax sp.]